MNEGRALRYSARIVWSEEDGAFVATCPEFEGISVFGGTGSEAASELLGSGSGRILSPFPPRGSPEFPWVPTGHGPWGFFFLGVPVGQAGDLPRGRLQPPLLCQGIPPLSRAAPILVAGCQRAPGLLPQRVRPWRNPGGNPLLHGHPRVPHRERPFHSVQLQGQLGGPPQHGRPPPHRHLQGEGPHLSLLRKDHRREEEKETDVALGVKALELLHLWACDTLVIVSGDTDFTPALRTAKRLFPEVNVCVAFPTAVFSRDLQGGEEQSSSAA
jgi:hypothetical protein